MPVLPAALSSTTFILDIHETDSIPFWMACRGGNTVLKDAPIYFGSSQEKYLGTFRIIIHMLAVANKTQG